jgi:hypothetical protein
VAFTLTELRHAAKYGFWLTFIKTLLE